MNSSPVHGSQSAENPIASKKPDAKLRKRPEDEVPADSAAAEATDQELLVAQAAPAAAAEDSGGGGGAAGGGAAAPGPAAEGSASAGAGAAPAAFAAGGVGGLGIGALALGAGALGLAAAGGHGGGGGGGSASFAPTASATQIHNFGEYMSVVNSGGATAAANAFVVPGPGPTSVVDISGGFSRSALPHTLTELRPMTTYNVTGASVATINDGGIAVDLQGNPDTHVNAHSNATSGSNLMWMQNLSLRDQVGQGATIATASATAAGAGSDAEIGIQHVAMAIAGSGGLNERTDLAATATGGASAHTLVGDVNLHMDSSAIGTSAAPIAAQIHMGAGEGTQPGIIASASGAGSSATVGVTGNVALSGHADEVYVYNSGVFAQGTNGGSAHTDIGGNISFDSNGRDAHSYILVDASTDAAAGSAADVHIHGNVDLESVGTEQALTRAAVRADGGGTVEIDGHLSADSSAPAASSFMQVIAQGGTGEISIGSLDMSMHGVGHGWMDLSTDHSGGLSVGAVNLSATAAGSDISLHVQNANDAVNGIVDGTFLAHTDGTANVSIATANVGGEGEVHMFLNSQTFGTINQAASLPRLDVHYQLADQDAAGVGSAPMTTINGFTASHDEVIYNGGLADATNFTDAGSFTSLDSLNAGVNAALDGTHKYVFATYNGTEDINHNGVADDHGSGVLAWDDNGIGITSVLMLPGVTTLTASDLS